MQNWVSLGKGQRECAEEGATLLELCWNVYKLWMCPFPFLLHLAIVQLETVDEQVTHPVAQGWASLLVSSIVWWLSWFVFNVEI